MLAMLRVMVCEDDEYEYDDDNNNNVDLIGESVMFIYWRLSSLSTAMWYMFDVVRPPCRSQGRTSSVSHRVTGVGWLSTLQTFRWRCKLEVLTEVTMASSPAEQVGRQVVGM